MYFFTTLPADLNEHPDAATQAESPPWPLLNVSENLWHNSVKGIFRSSVKLCIGGVVTHSHMLPLILPCKDLSIVIRSGL